MPRLELDGPELQALAAIRQMVAPLIVKRISDVGEKITSLAVFNAMATFRFEIEQMFLCLRKEQELTKEDYEHFLHDWRRLLQLLEGLVDEQVLRPRATLSQDGSRQLDQQLLSRSEDFRDLADHEQQDRQLLNSYNAASEAHRDETPSIIGYPKLQALVRRASDELTSSDLSLLLRLPETEAESKMAERIVTDFNTSNSTRSSSGVSQDIGDIDPVHTSPHKLSDNSASRPDLESVRQSHECLPSLLNILIRDIEARSCRFNHIAKLQVRDPEGSPESSDGVQHKIFMSSCLVPNKWQETICKVVTQLPPSKPNLQDINNVCETVQQFLEDERTLKVTMHGSRMLHDPTDWSMTSKRPILPMLSMEDLLDSGPDYFTPYEKVILALNLSRALLRMYGADIQSREWTATDIFFLFDPEEETVYEAYNPYLACSLLRLQRSGDSDPACQKRFPILISFGKLLLEIALGKILPRSYHRPPHIALLAEVLPEDSEVKEKVVTWYVDAIEKCLKAKKNSDDDEDTCGEVISQAISCLEEARTKGFATRKGPNSPKQFKVSRAVHCRPPSEKLNNTAMNGNDSSLRDTPLERFTNSTATYTYAASPGRLFDDGMLDVTVTDSRSSLALDFLRRVHEWYNNHIKHLCNNRKIRIAILDTGVDETNPFFRGIRRRRRSQDTPFKENKSFVEGDKVDTFGHGTNVAALVLDVAPETDLYVAKISQSQEMDEVDQVVKAIKWARGYNVHIIIMSFGLSEENADVQVAIKEAEYGGVILFAAASNYGGNNARAFPAILDTVLCIHATDGYGNDGRINPSPWRHRENLSTLGVAIPSRWKDGVYLSGTSYAAPVAAAIAANVLRFIQYARDSSMLTEDQRKKAFSCSGMRNILFAMSENRDGYDYVTPWRRMWNQSVTVQDVVTKIKEALKGNVY